MSAISPKLVRSALFLFIAGIGMGLNLSTTIAKMAIFFLLVLLIYLFILRKFEINFLKTANLTWVAVLILALSLGLLRAAGQIGAALPGQNFQAAVFNDTAPTIYGAVTSVKVAGTAQYIKVYSQRYPEFKAGDIVSVVVKSNKNESKGYISGELKLLQSARGLSVLNLLSSARREFLESLRRALPEPHASFVAGTLIGGAAGIPQDIKDTFRESGISHILAASGYNFTLLLIFFSFLLRSFSVKRQTLIFLLIIPSFAFMAGATPAVLRAGLMSGLVAVAIFSGRIAAAKTSLLWAGGLMLAISPQLLKFDLGFQLSFLAMFGLVMIVPIFEKIFPRRYSYHGYGQKLGRGLKESLFATLAAQIATLPLIAYYFGTISLVAVFVNLLVVPIIPLVMVIGIVSGLVGFLIPPLAQILVLPAWFLANYVFGAASGFARLSWATLYAEFSTVVLVSAYAIMALLLIYLHKKLLKHRYRLV